MALHYIRMMIYVQEVSFFEGVKLLVHLIRFSMLIVTCVNNIG